MARERNTAVVTSLLPVVLAVYLVLASDASIWWAVAAAVVGVSLAAFMLRRGRHTPWAQAAAAARLPGRAVVFWKPGCRYCERLLKELGEDRRITWVNVWRDRAANAELRRLNDGDEYTPTALVGLDVLRNPSAADLRAALAAGEH